MTSGDIELNPGPEQNLNSQTILSVVKLAITSARIIDLLMLVVKATVFFFQAVSHQLYGDPNHHLLIRQAGVQYLSNNPGRFIESMQGT